MPDEPWTKRDDETQRAYNVFCVYRDLGPNRSLQKCHDHEDVYGKGPDNIRQIEKWSSAYDWVARTEAYDQYLEEQRRQEYEKEMTSGLAHAGLRVRKLKNLASELEDEIFEQGNHWVTDVKIGPSGEQVAVQRYNGQLVRDFQRTLDDLAKEVGGRKQKVDVTTQGKAMNEGINVSIEGAVPIIERATGSTERDDREEDGEE